MLEITDSEKRALEFALRQHEQDALRFIMSLGVEKLHEDLHDPELSTSTLYSRHIWLKTLTELAESFGLSQVSKDLEKVSLECLKLSGKEN